MTNGLVKYDDVIKFVMDDVVKRSEVQKTLKWCGIWGDARVRSVVNSIPSAQSWIPVTERLPEEEEKCYWVCTDTGYQCQCEWTSNVFGIGDSDRWGWKIFDIPQYSHVVAWMSLPEPYREDGAT